MVSRLEVSGSGACRALASIACLFLLVPAAWAQQGERALLSPSALADADSDEGDEDADLVPLRAVSKDVPAKPASAPPVTALAGVAKQADDDVSKLWEIPPVPWGATLTLSGGRIFPSGGSGSASTAQQLVGRGNSYVWYPWFLKLDGGFSASQSQSSSDSGNNEARTLGGSLNGQLLPGGAYPFGFSTSIMDSTSESRSKTTSGSVASNIKTLSLGMNQRFSRSDALFSGAASYNQLRSSASTSLPEGGSEQFSTVSHNLGAQVAVPIRSENPQSLTFDGVGARSSNRQAGAETRLYNLNGAHLIYLEDYVMTISSDVRLNRNDQTAGATGFRTSTTQLGSSLDWIPSDDYPLSLGASARISDAATQAGNSETRFSVASLTGDARYPMSRNWNFSSRFSGTQAQSVVAGSDAMATQAVFLTANANWSGDGLSTERGPWLHSVFYGAGSSLTTSSTRGGGNSAAESVATLGGSASQTFSRKLERDGASPFMLALSQALSGSASSNGPPAQGLSHGLQLSWDGESGPGFRTRYNFAATDGRSFGSSNLVYQQVNGNASADMTTGAYSSVGGNGTIAFNRTFSDHADGQWKGSAAAGGRYNHTRFAGVNGLNYQATYNLAIREILSSASGGVSGSGSFQLEHSFNQGWSWRLGLLGWRIDHSATKSGNSGIGQSVFISVTRDFRGVL